MDLIERLKKLAELNGIQESRLILDEARFFEDTHRDHGCYEMQFFYDENNDLYSIDLKCRATQIKVKILNSCDRDEFPTSIIYDRESDGSDIEAQKERRERTRLEFTLKDFGYEKYETEKGTDNANGLIHLWYLKDGKWEIKYYLKKKK